MIKHLTPRNKTQIFISRFLDIFNWRTYQYTEFFHKTRDFFSLRWYWVRSSYLAKNQKDWIGHYNRTADDYAFKNMPSYWPSNFPIKLNEPNEFDSEINIIRSTLLWKETYPYVYTYNENKKNIIATIWVVEREWERRWNGNIKKWKGIRFKKNKVERKIDVSFKPALHRVTQCDYVMEKNETPYETLKRMEKNRIFN